MPIPTAAAPAETSLSYALVDARGTELAAADAGRPYYAASTIKLHVLRAALRAAAAGALDLDARVPATRTFVGADWASFLLEGDHVDPTHPVAGTPIAVRELLVRMIDRSSNEATNHVIDLIGLDAVAATVADLGLAATRVERRIGDAAALAGGATNETSAEDLARTMHAIVAPGASGRDLALAALRAQQIPVIATALRPGVEWGSKSGWVEGYRHDVAVLGDPDSEDLQVLAVMTAGLAQGEADRRIAGIVRELVPDLAA
ncbi:serine hydrolase [Brachybacterium sp. YJGR34]|uniref:serine hydrolase n=1 Tax=Brachybacterium sp. YJGR34 TaxID=2059911 RepID=UPI000E0A0CC9|nr:serine hydrolase [Brachybacterium sp. YJGR34]